MKINQLFRDKVPEDVMCKVLACFDLSSLKDTKTFTKDDMIRLKSVDKLKMLTDELKMYYLPCKAKIYLNITCENNGLTVLRHILKLNNVTLHNNHKYINKKKISQYFLKEKLTSFKTFKQTNELVHVTFE